MRFRGIRTAVAAAFILAAVGVTSAAAAAAGPGHDVDGLARTAAATQATQRVADQIAAASPNIPGVLIRLDAPRRHLHISVATGVSDLATRAPLSPDATFRIASNTKTFTAASALRLAEDGRLGLDDDIADHLPRQLVRALTAGGYRPDLITVRQLLLHTSGIYDFAEDPGYPDAVLADPNHRWTRLEQVQFAMDHGQPLGAPGEVFGYSDTGYSLLGAIIERTTGLELGRAYRALLNFDELGLNATYRESFETPPVSVPARAHQYFDTEDTFGWDPSFDLYGGGGLVSNTSDLSTFYRALLRGRILHRHSTLTTMLLMPPPAHLAMGLDEHDVAGQTCWGHDGFWGTYLLTCPKIDVTVAISINQAFPGDQFDRDTVFEHLVRIAETR